MAVEKDQSAWLPEPPPPRPARRDAAIDAALRRFDGIEDAASVAPARQTWARRHRQQLAVAFSAMLLVVVGIPAALIGLRNAPPPQQSPRPAQVERHAAIPPAAPPVQKTPSPAADMAQVSPSTPRPRSLPPARNYRSLEQGLQANNEPAAKAAIPPVVAAPPAPPLPMTAAAPPPPPPPPSAARAAGGRQW